MASAERRALLQELFVAPILAQRGRLVAIFGALAALSLAQGLFLLMVNRFFRALFQDQGRDLVPVTELVPAGLLRLWPDWQNVSVPGDVLVVGVPGAILMAGLTWALATYVFQLNQQAVALSVARSFRETLFASLVQRPFLEIRRRPAGEWMSVVMNDVMFLQTRLSDVMTGVVRGTVVIVSAFAVLLFMHWPTAAVLAIAAPFVAFGMGRTGKRIARYSEAFQKELRSLAGMVLDLRARFDFIRSQGAGDRERERFFAASRRYYLMIRRSILVRSAFAPALEAIGFTLFALCIYAIGHGLWRDFTPDLMMQFLLALGVMLKPLKDLGEQLTRLSETRGVLNESLAVLQADNGRVETSGRETEVLPQVFAVIGVRRMAAGFGGAVKFQADGLDIVPGRAVAIVGPSGAGKSTLVKTLAGLIQPMQWEASIAADAATAQVSMVSQEPFLFDDTVRENLVYGFNRARRPSDNSIWEALRVVNVATEVEAMPQRLETRVRAIGANLSGGQVQRLVIARALLRHKPVLLLDEATSAIDARTERDITERLVAACRSAGLALLAVTHRLSWLALYHEVWFVEDGRLQLRGRHEDLLGHARYAAYCASIEGSALPGGGRDQGR